MVFLSLYLSLDDAYYVRTITLINQNLIERMRSAFYLFLADTVKIAVILSVIKLST